ncbi:uncharacterized protein PV09_07897 [Verruconis gallopava]|uniref:Azaphilone pigments biosynthesis cluster protein L N-terminal domain-containing protein n=1 Tax=Verruconis gallopava TaxID=253628 RepID=A0A0D1YI90_9PEZI|nr:uncharacterized protein PV09_07897 [Verruconis gallopava]KIW00542.1 hypothetical protein PV09_07897 [Verruconis gallopava]
MTDPLSVSAAILAVITAAAQATKLLHETVESYKGRDKTLKKLDDELNDMIRILDSLAQAKDIDDKMWDLLKDPVKRCSEVCREFEQAMQAFGKKSKTGIRDWTRLEFRKGDINDFIDQIASYKSTIAVGLGIITMHNSRVTRQFLQEYMELVKDTSYSLELHLQRIEEKMALDRSGSAQQSEDSVDLADERAVTKKCLRICEDAWAYIEALMNRESTVLNEATSEDSKNAVNKAFEAQLETRRLMDENRDSLAEIIGWLRQRLETLVVEDDPGSGVERQRLQQDIDISKRCLELCKLATKMSREKIHVIDEAIADDYSDQMVLTTVADLFSVKTAKSMGHSTQVVGSMTPENFQSLTEKRYNGHVVRPVVESSPAEAGASRPAPVSEPSKSVDQTVVTERSQVPRPGYTKPFPNEVRKRFTRDDHDDV